MRADPRLPVSASLETAAPGQTVDLEVSISEEVAAGATRVEAALFYVCPTVSLGPRICVVEREQLAVEGAVAAGPRRASLTLPAWAPASSAASWYVGAVVLRPRGQDMRSFTPLQVKALPDPDARAANADPKITGEKPGSYKGYVHMSLDLESHDIPAGGAVEGVLHVIPVMGEEAPMKVLDAEIELITGIASRPGALEYPDTVSRQKLLGNCELPSRVPVALPFRFELPADARPTSDTGSPVPLGYIMRSSFRIDEGVYAPGKIVKSRGPMGDAESNLWWLEAKIGWQSYGWRFATLEQEIRVHDAVAPAGWYSDPGGGGWRWWDGSAWTGHVSPGGG